MIPSALRPAVLWALPIVMVAGALRAAAGWWQAVLIDDDQGDEGWETP